MITELADWPALFWDDTAIMKSLGRARYAEGTIGLGSVSNVRDEFNAILPTLLQSTKPSFQDGKLRSGEVLEWMQQLGERITMRQEDEFVELYTGSPENYKLPKSDHVLAELEACLDWFNNDEESDLLVKGGVAYLWIMALHPFSKHNRTFADLMTYQLTHLDPATYPRFLESWKSRESSLMQQLHHSLHSNLDITDWLNQYLQSLATTFEELQESTNKNIPGGAASEQPALSEKDQFWLDNGLKIKNSRQEQMVRMLLNDPTQTIQSSDWATTCNCSHDTALRDIQDLVEKGVMQKLNMGGRSTSYRLLTE